MNAQTARSRREIRENGLLKRLGLWLKALQMPAWLQRVKLPKGLRLAEQPKWVRWLVGGILLFLAVDLVWLAVWAARSGGLSEIKLLQDKPQKIYLPFMVTNPTANPELGKKPTPTPQFEYKRHEIQWGDTLLGIAMKYDISLEMLLAVNPEIDEDSILNIGDILFIPPRRMTLADVPPTPTRAPKPTKTPKAAGSSSSGSRSAASNSGSGSEAASASPTRKPPVALAVRVSEINGVPIDKIIVLPPEVIDNITEVFASGQEKGRNADAFVKIGDSTIESPFFMDRFDSGPYELGEYTFLQKAINFFQGSFSIQGPAVRRGMHAWSIFDPMWTNYSGCKADESPVECSYRIQNPAFVFIRLGSNDAGRPDLFASGMKQLIEMSLKRGIIPILGTKADRAEGDNENNRIIRELAADYDVPLWDFDQVAQTLPNHGIGDDGVHLTTFYAHDFTLPEALQTGYGVHTLTGLMMLYELWRILVKS